MGGEKHRRYFTQPEKKTRAQKFKLDIKKATQFSHAVKTRLQLQLVPLNFDHNWRSFLAAIKGSADICFGTTKNSRNHAHRSFPYNKWYDDNCKDARRKVMTATNEEERAATDKTRKALRRRKRRIHEVHTTRQKSIQLAHCPKGFCKDTKMPMRDSGGDINMEQMLSHAKSLYEQETIDKMPNDDGPDKSHTGFHIEDITWALQKMANRKATDLQSIQAELLKWGRDEVFFG